MPRKVFKVQVELDIQAVTCPGVWLCPNGKVSLQVYMLDSCIQTSNLEPVFPLLCHEKFLFYKIFDKAHRLSDVQHLLSKECFYAELIQWRNCDVGNVLATFQTSLCDVLYPRTFQGAIAGVDVDLLMEPSKKFPGIIAPKIEISTRTTIEETLCSSHHKKCSAFVVNPKMVRSCHQIQQHPQKIRQKRVCHSIDYHRSRRTHKNSKQDRRPPFQFRKAEEELISRKPQGIGPETKYNCKCSGQTEYLGRTLTSSQRKSYTDITEQFLKNYLKGENCKQNSGWKNKSQDKAKKCNCGSGHIERNCPLCAKYKHYFDETPIGSSRPKPTEVKSYVFPCGKINCRCLRDSKEAQENKIVRHTKNGDSISEDVEYNNLHEDDIVNNKQNDDSDDEDDSYNHCHKSCDEFSAKKNNKRQSRPCCCALRSRDSLAELIHKRLSKTLRDTKESCSMPNFDVPVSSACVCPSIRNCCSSSCKGLCNALDKFYRKLYRKANTKADCEYDYCVPTCLAY